MYFYDFEMYYSLILLLLLNYYHSCSNISNDFAMTKLLCSVELINLLNLNVLKLKKGSVEHTKHLNLEAET